MTLDELKYEKICQVKNLAHNTIINEYEIYKQINIILLSGYTEEDRTNMVAFIEGVRERCKMVEALITNATNEDELNGIDIII